MKIETSEVNGTNIAEVASEKIEIKNVQDALDLMGNCDYRGARRIILHKKNISTEFFDLSTGIAGEILQKFSTYRVKLAIVGDFSGHFGKSLKDFIFESNKKGMIVFVDSVSKAKERLAKH
ncbi:MAG: DUF4180 domain-containing protein [Bacteroidales bacterium]|nr:DUF4180 domain-containing protein [Bacteroidales bacterium]